MDRITKLLNKAKPKRTLSEWLEKDNPYLGKTDAALLEYLDGNNYRAPEMHTVAWEKFMYALIHAEHEDNGIERGEYCGKNEIED